MKKIAKFKDYLNKSVILELSVSSVYNPFCNVAADGINILEVSREEWITLAQYFGPDENWDKKTIWGIKLKLI